MPDAGRTREPCVQRNCTLRTQATTGQPEQPAFPARWFTAYTWSPRSTGLVSLRPPGLVTRGLTPASGRRDRTISLVRAKIARLATPTRPPHPVSNVRDGRDAPLVESGRAERTTHFRKNGSKIFFTPGLDRANQIEMTRENCGFGAGFSGFRDRTSPSAPRKLSKSG